MIERIRERISHSEVKPAYLKQELDTKMERALVKETSEPDVPLKKEELQQFAEQVNKILQPTFTHIQFEYHDELKEYYAVLIDTETKEVIKEVPGKKKLDMYASLQQFTGLIFDSKI